MKLLKKCPLLLGVAAISIILTAASFAGEKTTYSEYYADYVPAEMPHFIPAIKGLREGVFPWMAAPVKEIAEAAAENPNGEEGFEEVIILDNQTPEEEQVIYISENDTSGIDISGNDISGNDIEEIDPDRTYELTEVDEDYFADALFIGDSRTVGLSEYCVPLDEKATFYAKVSLTIYDCMKKSFVKSGENKITIGEALSQQQFGKIYIMLGLNEIGTGTAETFAEQYYEVLTQIRELQPDAMIFIQGIMHVTERKSSNDKYFNNENINRRNEAIAQFADNRTVFYIDMNEATDDENGNLLQELTFDDVHLKASSYDRWYQYLLQHGIIKD